MARTRVGSAEIDLTLKTGRFTTAINKAKVDIAGLGTRLKSAATQSRSLTTALAGLAGAGFAAKKIFELGAAVAETGSKFDTVFGAQAGGVQQAIDGFATMAGLSNTAAKEITATTGAMVQGMGLSGRAAADFSVDVVKLAADLSSFNNIPIAETSRAIQAAVTGEREQLKRLGIVIKEVDVQQRALAMSGKAAAKELTQEEKALATMQLVTERAGFAIGDLANTQTSAANQARALGAEIQNLKEDISTALVPAFSVVITKVREFIGGMKLLGVDAAVAIARFQLAWAGSIFGSDEKRQAAINNLHFTSLAAREMRNEILGLNTALTGSETGSGGAGGGGTGAAVEAVKRQFGHFRLQLQEAVIKVPQLSAELLKLQSVLAGAANEQERLNRATSKFNAISGALGFAGGFLGPGASNLISKGLGAIGVGRGLTEAFASPTAAPVASLRISIDGISEGATRVIEGNLRDLNNRDIPVIL